MLDTTTATTTTTATSTESDTNSDEETSTNIDDSNNTSDTDDDDDNDDSSDPNPNDNNSTGIEIVSNTDPVHQTTSRSGSNETRLTFVHGIDILPVKATQNKKGRTSLFVGDVIPIACRGLEIVWPPIPNAGTTTKRNNHNKTWYPFGVPWKIGQILSIVENTTFNSVSQSIVEKNYKMQVRWLHRCIHLDKTKQQDNQKHVLNEINEQFDKAKQQSLLIESNHINEILINPHSLRCVLSPILRPSSQTKQSSQTYSYFRSIRFQQRQQQQPSSDNTIVSFRKNNNHHFFHLVFECSLSLVGEGKTETKFNRSKRLTKSTNVWNECTESKILKALQKGWKSKNYMHSSETELITKQEHFYKQEQVEKKRRQRSWNTDHDESDDDQDSGEDKDDNKGEQENNSIMNNKKTKAMRPKKHQNNVSVKKSTNQNNKRKVVTKKASTVKKPAKQNAATAKALKQKATKAATKQARTTKAKPKVIEATAIKTKPKVTKALTAKTKQNATKKAATTKTKTKNLTKKALTTKPKPKVIKKAATTKASIKAAAKAIKKAVTTKAKVSKAKATKATTKMSTTKASTKPPKAAPPAVKKQITMDTNDTTTPAATSSSSDSISSSRSSKEDDQQSIFTTLTTLKSKRAAAYHATHAILKPIETTTTTTTTTTSNHIHSDNNDPKRKRQKQVQQQQQFQKYKKILLGREESSHDDNNTKILRDKNNNSGCDDSNGSSVCDSTLSKRARCVSILKNNNNQTIDDNNNNDESQQPFHLDRSTNKVYYYSIQIAPPYGSYCIQPPQDTGNNTMDHYSRWTVTLGDVVILHTDHRESVGRTYFEPPKEWFTHSTNIKNNKKNNSEAATAITTSSSEKTRTIDTDIQLHQRTLTSNNYPFTVPWGVGEVVSIWNSPKGDDDDDDDSSDNDGDDDGYENNRDRNLMVEIRWMYRKKELPGFTKNLVDSSDHYYEELEEVYESDHYLECHVSCLLSPAVLHSNPKRNHDANHYYYSLQQQNKNKNPNNNNDYYYTPIIDFFCRRFWSIHRKSLIPCKGLDGRIERGRLHSKTIGKDHILRDKLANIVRMAQQQQQQQEQKQEQGQRQQQQQQQETKYTSITTTTHNSDDKISSNINSKQTKKTTLSTNSTKTATNATTKQFLSSLSSSSSSSRIITSAFNKVIAKLSLTDASKETSCETMTMIGREKEQEKIMTFLRGAISSCVTTTNNTTSVSRDDGGGGGMIPQEHQDNNISSSSSSTTGYSLFVAGPPGVGKTACIRNCIAKLRREQVNGKIREFDFIALNGMEMRHPFEAYTRLWESIREKDVNCDSSTSADDAAVKLETHFTREVSSYFNGNAITNNNDANDNTSHNYINNRKRKRATRRNGDVVTVVLLDEIDYLVTQKQTVMYNFFDWPRRAATCKSHDRRLIVIGVSNTLNLPERLQPRVQSRIGSRRCYFKSYNVQEINSILKAKIQEASPKYSVFDGDAIIFAARKTAAVSGDVRKAFHICKSAAERVLNLYIDANRQERKAKRKQDATTTTKYINNTSSLSSPPLVRIADVQKVSRDSFNSGLSLAVAQSTPFEALLLVSLGSLRRSTGRESGGFDIEELLIKMEALAGASGDPQYTPAPALQEALFILQRLGEAHIVSLHTPKNSSFSYRSSLTGIGGAWPIVSLPIDDTAILIALRGTKHSILAEKYLSAH